MQIPRARAETPAPPTIGKERMTKNWRYAMSAQLSDEALFF